MIYHVLPGDAQTDEFRKTDIDGEVIVCRECLMVGPVDAPTLYEFWNERAGFILGEYGEDEIVYHERVADELERLRDLTSSDEVNLWFEYELFCSVNYWFCLWMLRSSGATVYRVSPVTLSTEDRWRGFGGFDAEALKTCFDQRVQLSVSDIELGSRLWKAFAAGDVEAMRQLGSEASGTFPYLDEVVDAASQKHTRPVEIVREIIQSGKKDLAEVFPEFASRAGVYGMGDSQVQQIIERLSS
jgi:hypothetical protein